MSTEPRVLQRIFPLTDVVAHQPATPLPVAGSVCFQPDCTPRESLATYDSRRHALQLKES